MRMILRPTLMRRMSLLPTLITRRRMALLTAPRNRLIFPVTILPFLPGLDIDGRGNLEASREIKTATGTTQKPQKAYATT
jgi:hypothetical protein